MRARESISLLALADVGDEVATRSNPVVDGLPLNNRDRSPPAPSIFSSRASEPPDA